MLDKHLISSFNCDQLPKVESTDFLETFSFLQSQVFYNTYRTAIERSHARLVRTYFFYLPENFCSIIRTLMYCVHKGEQGEMRNYGS